MKKFKIFSFVSLICLMTLLTSCKKDTATSSTDLTLEMLSEKIWYLNYTQAGSITNTYISSNTYYVKYLKNKTTEDSDGLVGTYSIVELDGQLQLKVSAKTVNNNTVNYTQTIETIGEKKLVLSYTPSGQTDKTTLYFSIK